MSSTVLTNKLVIGLTGGIGSGKSTVASLFSQYSILIIDTDQIARDLTQPNQSAVTAIMDYFGNDILLPTGQLNRKQLKKIIFADDKKRIWLENLLHPLIRKKMQEQIESIPSPYYMAVIPLLLETKPNPLVNRILVVDASENLQMARTQLRDKLSSDEVKAIMKTQITREARLAAADDIIINNGKIEDLAEQVATLHRSYLKLASQKGKKAPG